MKEYLTVAEYAQVKGISKQRVYQILNNRLKAFVQDVDGRKVIDISAISEEELKALEQELEPQNQELKQGVEQDDSTPSKRENQRELDILEQALDLLRAQLEVKDKQIAELQKESAIKDKHIQDQAKELSRLLSQSQELQRNNQLLMASSNVSEPSVATQPPEVSVVVDTPPVSADPAIQQQKQSTEAPFTQQPKKSFWARLLNR